MLKLSWKISLIALVGLGGGLAMIQTLIAKSPAIGEPQAQKFSTGDPVIMAAGDIACSPDDVKKVQASGQDIACRMQETADLLIQQPLAAVLALGDLQYPRGELANFQASYDRTWGKVKKITRPAPGNHEYYTPKAAGYYQYFGAIAKDPSKGYYSYNLGKWHLIALNSNCKNVGGCGPGSPQEKWLKADLAASRHQCTLAYWHHPRFSSGLHNNNADTAAFWQALYAAGAEVILTGHDHDYERFAPQTPDAKADPQRGIRQFVVGTGGFSLRPFLNQQANSEVRNADAFGVLKLTLKPKGYDWQFIPIQGQTFQDSGSGDCHT